MAYNQCTYGHAPPWSPDNRGSQNSTSYQPSAVSSSAESPLQMAIISEPQGGTQRWDSQAYAYATASYETYAPNTSFQHPIPDQIIPSSTAFTGTTYYTTLTSQHTPTANSPSSQAHLPYYQYVTTPPSPSPPHTNHLLETPLLPTTHPLPPPYHPNNPLPHQPPPKSSAPTTAAQS